MGGGDAIFEIYELKYCNKSIFLKGFSTKEKPILLQITCFGLNSGGALIILLRRDQKIPKTRIVEYYERGDRSVA